MQRHFLWTGVVGASLFVVTTLVGGLLTPGYSHLSQYISELYADQAPYATLLRFSGYLPSGLLLMAFGYVAYTFFPPFTRTRMGFIGLGVCYGLGTVIVSLFPCDQGCNKAWIHPSISQLIHNLTGMLTYMVVPFCLLMLGWEAMRWPNGHKVGYGGIAAGLLSLLCVGVLFAYPDSSYIGLVQRVLEGSVLSWIVACAFYGMKAAT